MSKAHKKHPLSFKKGHTPWNKGNRAQANAVCDQCGTKFHRNPSLIKKHKNHFCSRGCHASFRAGKPRSDVIIRKISETLKRKYAIEGHPALGRPLSEETKMKLSKAMKGRFTGENSPNYGKPCSEETKRRISEAQKGEKHHFWGKRHSEETKLKMSEARKGRSPSEKTRQKLREAGRRRRHSVETRRIISEAMKDEKNPNYGKPRSEETKRRISEAQKGEKHHFWGKHHSEETKLKMSEALKGEKNHNWLGGTSSEPYNFNWKHTRKLILKRDDYKCQMPDCNNPGNEVHHIDYDKKNDKHSNLITLCLSCHGKTGHNRDYWISNFNGGITVENND